MPDPASPHNPSGRGFETLSPTFVLVTALLWGASPPDSLPRSGDPVRPVDGFEHGSRMRRHLARRSLRCLRAYIVTRDGRVRPLALDTEPAGAELNWRVAPTHEEVFQRYMFAGAITRNPDAIAAMFTEDGVYEAPLAPDSHPLRYLVGRDAIRSGTSVYHQQPTYQGTMNVERSAYVLHDTADPDVFIAEIDVAFDEADGRWMTMSLVWIFRLRDEQISMFRDYFTELPSLASGGRTS